MLVIYTVPFVNADTAECGYYPPLDCVPENDYWVVAWNPTAAGCEYCCIRDDSDPRRGYQYPFHTAKWYQSFQDRGYNGNNQYMGVGGLQHPGSCNVCDGSAVDTEEWCCNSGFPTSDGSAFLDMNVYSNSQASGVPNANGWCGATGRCSNHENPPPAGDNGYGIYQFYDYPNWYDDLGRIHKGCGKGLTCANGICVSCGNSFESTLTMCQNGDDDDCDGLVDCEDPDCYGFTICDPLPGPSSPKLRWTDGSTGDTVAVIGSEGVMYIAGTLWDNQFFIPETGSNNDFVVKDSAGLIVAWLERETGDLYLTMSLNADLGDSISATSGSDLIVQNGTGDIVAVFDDQGNLWLRDRFEQYKSQEDMA